MTSNLLIALALIVPLFGAAVMGLVRHVPNIRESVTLITAVGLFVLVICIAPSVLAGERPSLTIFELLPGLTIAFEVEPLGMLFAMVA